MADTLTEADVTVELESFEPDHLITPSKSRVEQFKQNLERLRKQNVEPKQGDDGRMYPVWHDSEHNYSHYQAQVNYNRAKDIERYFWRNCEEFTTVHIVRTADENDAPLVEQTEALTPDAYKQSRYGKLRRLSEDYSEDFARITVLAPKYPTRPNSRVRTHAHEEYCVPGHHSADSFELLRDKHHQKVPGATSVSISVEHHSSDEGPPVVQGKDRYRGGTSALPHELAGANQPLMDVENDALDLHDPRAIEWCAALSAGSNGDNSNRGLSYWREGKNAKKCGDEIENSMRRQVWRDYKRTKLPDQTQGSETNVMPELDEPEPSPLGISKPARESLIQAVSQLAQIPTPDRRLETLDIGRLRTSMAGLNNRANSRFSGS
jgi:hypothetical protein